MAGIGEMGDSVEVGDGGAIGAGTCLGTGGGESSLRVSGGSSWVVFVGVMTSSMDSVTDSRKPGERVTDSEGEDTEGVFGCSCSS